MVLLSPCSVPRGGFLYTMIVPGGGALFTSSHVLGGMVMDEIDTCINSKLNFKITANFGGMIYTDRSNWTYRPTGRFVRLQ